MMANLDEMEPLDAGAPMPEDRGDAGPSLEEFVTRHSEGSENATAFYTYRFHNMGGHDVLMLLVSGAEADKMMDQAATAAGLPDPDTILVRH